MFRHILSGLIGKKSAPGTEIVGERFLQVFREHGVHSSQIPRFIPEVSLPDLDAPARLLSALTPSVIDKTASLFGIRSQWLEGVDDEVYEYLSCYKRPEVFLAHVRDVCRSSSEAKWSSPVRVLTTTKHLDRHKDAHQIVVLVIVEPIAELGEKTIYRYQVFRDEFDWNYPPGRLQLKALARTLFCRLGVTVPLFEISEAEMDEVTDGLVIPRRLLRGALISNPSLEDFALSKEQSRVAKETDELPDVLQYIEEHGLQSYSFDALPEAPLETERTQSVETSTANAEPKSKGKRAALAAAWVELRAAARAIWAQDQTLVIEDVVRRLKGVSSLRASSFTESAIRKRIADLAPDGIRGKSGRKPRKTSSLLPKLVDQHIDR